MHPPPELPSILGPSAGSAPSCFAPGKPYDSSVNIALVGYTNSHNDQRWLEMAGAWMAEHDPALAWTSASRTVFDLRGENGVNFLDDEGVYDAVVLFAIYNPPMQSVEFKRALGRRSGQTSLAVNHSRRNWAARLSRTGAKYLFVFRRDDSIDGKWLGQIEHYEFHVEQAGVFGVSIYRRVGVLTVSTPTLPTGRFG